MTERWRRMFPGFRLRFTRWGGVFLVLTLILAFAAVNSGNNGLIAVLGAALGSYVVSGAWSREVLGHVSAAVRLPAETFAGRPALFEIELVNTSHIFPAYGLVIKSADGTIVLVESCVGPGQSVRRTVTWCFERRGRQQFGAWRLEVLLPLGFFVKSKEVLEDQTILVYPAPVPGPVGGREGDEADRGVERFVGRGREGDVFQLRDFRDGDDTRQIHWKQTARQQRMISVDRRRAVEKPLIIRLDPPLNDPDDPEVLSLFEKKISAATAAILRRLDRREPVVLAIGNITYPAEQRRAGARRLLEPLALVRPVGGAS
ncbi:MAG: DUF58 domain-containing protein [Acidobacteria bacterium]|nr:DUF58 domain-containing protein [Acidobacteriota bacterium]